MTHFPPAATRFLTPIRLQLTGRIFFITVEGIGTEYITMWHSRKGRRLLLKPWFEPQRFDRCLLLFGRRALFTSSPPRLLHVISNSPPSHRLFHIAPLPSIHLLHIVSTPPPSYLLSIASTTPPSYRLLHIRVPSPPPSRRLYPASFTSSTPRLLHIVSTLPHSHRLHPAFFTSSPLCLFHIVSTPPPSYHFLQTVSLHPASFTSSPPRSFTSPPSHCLHPASITSSPPWPIRILSPWISEFRLQSLHVCSVGLESLQSWWKPKGPRHVKRKWRLMICCAAEEDECFDPATKGRLYRGQNDYTRSMKLCMKWTRVTHCPHHAFIPGYADLHTCLSRAMLPHTFLKHSQHKARERWSLNALPSNYY